MMFAWAYVFVQGSLVHCNTFLDSDCAWDVNNRHQQLHNINSNSNNTIQHNIWSNHTPPLLNTEIPDVVEEVSYDGDWENNQKSGFGIQVDELGGVRNSRFLKLLFELRDCVYIYIFIGL